LPQTGDKSYNLQLSLYVSDMCAVMNEKESNFSISASSSNVGMLVATMSLTNGLSMSAYAAKHEKPFRYCFSNTVGTTCSQQLSTCKSQERNDIEQGHIVTEPCHKVN
jgi:hypothetical protein